MQKKYVTILKTNRYFLSKEVDEHIKKVIFCFHGYAQNADDFLQSLWPLAKEDTMLVSLEGPHKFYWKDFTNNPASSWMTKLERETELEDFYRYSQNIAVEICAGLALNETEFHVIGFSQGAAMSSRFYNQSLLPLKKLILIGGFPADEVLADLKTQQANLHLIYGNEDKFVSQERLQMGISLLNKNHVEANLHQINARHEINVNVLDVIGKIIFH